MGEITYLDDFNVLSGFKFLAAYETLAHCSDGTKETVTIMKFVNDKNVAIDVDIICGELRLGEPYAVDDEYLPLKKEEHHEQE